MNPCGRGGLPNKLISDPVMNLRAAAQGRCGDVELSDLTAIDAEGDGNPETGEVDGVANAKLGVAGGQPLSRLWNPHASQKLTALLAGEANNALVDKEVGKWDRAQPLGSHHLEFRPVDKEGRRELTAVGGIAVVAGVGNNQTG